MSILRLADFIFNVSPENILMSVDIPPSRPHHHFQQPFLSAQSLWILCHVYHRGWLTILSSFFPWYWNKGSPFCLFLLALSVPTFLCCKVWFSDVITCVLCLTLSWSLLPSPLSLLLLISPSSLLLANHHSCLYRWFLNPCNQPRVLSQVSNSHF